MTGHIPVLADSGASLHPSPTQYALCRSSHSYKYKVISTNPSQCQTAWTIPVFPATGQDLLTWVAVYCLQCFHTIGWQDGRTLPAEWSNAKITVAPVLKCRLMWTKYTLTSRGQRNLFGRCCTVPVLITTRRRRFCHATHDCVAPYVDIILHRGRF